MASTTQPTQANRITLDGVMGKIKGKTFTVLPDGRTTICQLTLENGFTVNGHSACVDSNNFNAGIGEKYALDDAIKQIWPLEGYLLAQTIHEASDTGAEMVHDIAMVCHEVNRAYCQAMGDMSQPSFEDAPEWQVNSALAGVVLHLCGDFGPEASHKSWLEQKLAEGWTYGPVKDPVAKTHPCIVSFEMLPKEQRAKDYLFRAVVHSMAKVLGIERAEMHMLSESTTGNVAIEESATV